MATSGLGGATGVNGANANQTGASNDSLRGLDLNQFLQLMITELQNQDPLNPMDNTQILEQIGTMRQIGASATLTETLESILLGQNLSSASGMIGKSIRALSDDGSTVEGVVQRVSVVEGVPRLHVGEKSVRLTNVKEILGEPATQTQE